MKGGHFPSIYPLLRILEKGDLFIMTDEFLENLGLEISLPETPAEESKADSVEEQEKVETPKEEVETRVEEVAPEKDSQQEELARLRKENENLNKRLKDTQRSLTKKSEELKRSRGFHRKRRCR